MKVRRQKDDSLVVTLPVEEADLLRDLPGRLRGLLENPDFSDRCVQRLFPTTYSDPEKEAEHRRLLGDYLIQSKLRCVEAFELSLKSSTLRRRRVELRITAGDFELWLGFVNDMRLLLGTELDIHDDNWSLTFDVAHPRVQDLALLHYLSWLEESLLHARFDL